MAFSFYTIIWTLSSRTQISLDVTLLLGQYENKVLDGHKKEFDIGAFMCAQKVS